MFKHILFLFLALGLTSAFGQTATLKGKVSDKNTGEALPGVSIQENLTRNGTVTDAAGTFTLNASPSGKLTIYLLGYERQVIAIGSKREFDIVLSPSNDSLQTIVVTALGVKREEKSLGYAIQKLESKDVSEVKAVNFLDNLAGKIAGLTVSQGATGVGSTSKITIRGEASFTNNNPLFVVDGIPINNNSINNFSNDDAAGLMAVDFGNGAMEVNSDDVESVSVLKGPAAAALYGTRASNGVILINTKSGKKSKGLGVSLNSSTYFERPFRLPKFQNTYGQGNSGKFEYRDGLGGGVNDNISYSFGPRMGSDVLIRQHDSPVQLPDGRVVRAADLAVTGSKYDITPTPFEAQPDNLSDFYQVGMTQITNLAISSGFDKGNYRLSYTDLNSKSFIPGTNLKRRNLAGRLTFNPIEKLELGTVINYVNSGSDNRPANGYGSENINYALVAWGPRNMNIRELSDYWQPGFEGIRQYSFNYTFFDNPYFTLLENRNSFNRDRVFGNVYASYAIRPNMNIKVRSGMDYSNELRQFRRAFSSNRFVNGAYGEQTVFFREINTDVLVDYNHKIGDFDLTYLLGANRLDQTALNNQLFANRLAQPGVFNLTNAATPLEVNQRFAEKRINSTYGIVKAAYKNFAYAELTARNDWSSALASPISAKNSSFFYPSLSTAVILSNVLEMPSYLSFAKVRANIAQVGNDTDPYQTAGVFNARTPYGGQPTFSEQGMVANANLQPEKTTAFEVGADVRFFEGALRLDATYYNALTANQIISLPIAASSGFSQQVVNGGKVRSTGVEILLETRNIRTNRFEWNTSLNFSRNVARVLELPEGVSKLTIDYNRVYDNVNQTVWIQVEEGGRIGDIYGTGYRKTEDGKFIVNKDGNLIADNNLKKLGNYNPDFIVGMSNNFTYKNFNLNFLIDWRQGGILVSRTLALAAVGGQLRETENRPDEGIIVDGVVNVGTDAEPVYEQNTKPISAESYYRQFYDRNHEENNTYNASYVKLREISLGYTINRPNSKSLLFRNGQSMKVSIIARNVAAISNTPHFDPEQTAVQGQRFLSGVEDMSYPTARMIGFKIGYDF
ncbi:MAG TPA: SusC/RagA family TonB-linked outer membrane protein [Luteibaculaceae bacterium]|nr:SusC/RagA family TonB-linked outer membrane protein [Luteibaculaceae bacterium]